MISQGIDVEEYESATIDEDDVVFFTEQGLAGNNRSQMKSLEILMTSHLREES
jgi:hypothetical protein